MSRRRIGRIQCTVEALHNTEEVLFEFLDANFKTLEVDHSRLETEQVVELTLLDISDNFYFLSLEEPYPLYTIEGHISQDGVDFKAMLTHPLNEEERGIF